jgi:hypothetical protein
LTRGARGAHLVPPVFAPAAPGETAGARRETCSRRPGIVSPVRGVRVISNKRPKADAGYGQRRGRPYPAWGGGSGSGGDGSGIGSGDGTGVGGSDGIGDGSGTVTG